jgi:AcrR family transcriptional regulator
MASDPGVKPARERIVDAAATVMREKGLTNATTKAIAAEAGYSEAMLYKHFADKQQLFLAVLSERMRPAAPPIFTPGEGDVADNLAQIVEQLMAYFAELFPMSASLFGSPDLLAQHRDGIAKHGGDPSGPIRMVQRYLDAERDTGRIPADVDTDAVAQLLVGAAFQQGFLAAFAGTTAVRSAAEISRRLVAAVATTV